MNKSGLVEFVNHSYAMHSIEQRRGSLMLEDESLADYKNVFIADTMKLSNAFYDNCKIKTEAYAFPYGFYCQEALDILKSLGFKVYLTCAEKPNYITKSPDSLIELNRYNRPSGISTDEFMEKSLSP
jgi:peptidoglycan/xylan/chitin deacetylase (PgdA/CDA1 family)